MLRTSRTREIRKVTYCAYKGGEECYVLPVQEREMTNVQYCPYKVDEECYVLPVQGGGGMLRTACARKKRNVPYCPYKGGN